MEQRKIESHRFVNHFDVEKYPNCHKGHDYALRIVAGEITACVYIIAACERYLREVQDGYSPKYYFDPDKAEKFLRLVQRFDHVIGKWPTKNIVFEPWQCWIWMNIMGFINSETTFRRFRIAHIEVARGNAKSAMASQAALYFLCLDDPQGNKVATVATKKDQARIVLDSARAMAEKNKSFIRNTGVKVLAHSIVHKKSNSEARALASEKNGLDGLNDVLAVCDELHAMRKETFEVIYSGMSKRKDSLTLCITTAGFDLESIGYSQSIYAQKVATGVLEDDQFFAAVYTLDKEDLRDNNFYKESCWVKANPNWEVSVDPETFRAKIEKSKHSPTDVPNLKTKHLNIWLSEANAFYDLTKWDQCEDKTLKIEDFKRKKCKMGLDLASHLDLTCYGMLFKKDDTYYFFEKTFIPEATVKMQQSSLYENSIANGYLIQTPGEAINYENIQEHMIESARDFRVDACMYDAWNAIETAQTLSEKIEMVKFQMNVANFSAAMKKLDVLMREGKIRHNGSPLLRWCIGNVVAKRDHNDNVYPRKSHEKLKIDPAITLLMALAAWLQDDQKKSVYEERGLRTV